MKKLLALMLAAALALSLVACGNDSGAGDTNTPSTGNGDATSTDTPSGSGDNAQTADGDILTSVDWLPLYGSKLVLNDDGTMMMGNNSGTWSQDGTSLTLTYTVASGDTFEACADIIEENGITVLQFRKEGKRNGETTTLFIDNRYPGNRIDEIKAPLLRELGETVSSDIMEVTVKKASLGLYATSAETGSDGKTVNIDEAYEPSTDGLFFKSSKGSMLVCLDFVLKNTDRDSVYTDDSIVSFGINQDGHYSAIGGYDPNSAPGGVGLHLQYFSVAQNGGDFYTQKSAVSMKPGDTYEIKAVFTANFEAENLSAPFEVIVTVNNSNGSSEEFIYTIG